MSIRAVLWLVSVTFTYSQPLIHMLSHLGLDGLVLGSSETKKSFLKSDQGRSWTTFIECVSATGNLLKPGIIFKGKDLQGQWFINEFRNLADWYYICSENGWTSNEIILAWLEHVFLPQTTPGDEGEARLLILDGHKSYTTVKSSRISISAELAN